MDVEGFVRVTNNSGEEYEDAQVRLVVGTINLVEKIAQLAQIPMAEVDEAGRRDCERASTEAAHATMHGSMRPARAARRAAPAQPAEKEIIKEGLSEYFIYTIEGTETIPNGWSKRMRSLRRARQCRSRSSTATGPQEYGDQLVRMYLLTNDEESKLGTTPLPDGVVRVFRDNGRDGLSYLTQQPIKYIPIGDKIELNLGPDPEVIFELIKLRTFRDDIWMQIHGTNDFQQGRRRRRSKRGERHRSSAGTTTSIYSQRIRNYTAKPIDVEIRRSFDGHIVFRSQLEPKLHDYPDGRVHGAGRRRRRSDLLFEIVQHQGRNAKQNNVTLETAEIK